jgi:hypothetical protein
MGACFCIADTNGGHSVRGLRQGAHVLFRPGVAKGDICVLARLD